MLQPVSLADAIAGLAALKEEHRPLVQQIAADAGMSPETRAMLLAHLNEEEEERVAQIQALSAGGGSSATDAPRVPTLTVGSLRPDPATAVRPTFTGGIGSLRPTD